MVGGRFRASAGIMIREARASASEGPYGVWRAGRLDRADGREFAAEKASEKASDLTAEQTIRQSLPWIPFATCESCMGLAGLSSGYRITEHGRFKRQQPLPYADVEVPFAEEGG